MQSHLVRPPPDLDPWLSAGMAVAFDTPGEGLLPCHFPALAAGSITVVLRGGLFVQQGPALHAVPPAVVSGPRTKPFTLYRTPSLHCLGVLLRPAGTASVVRASPANLVDGMAQAQDVFGSAWRDFEDRIRTGQDDECIPRLFGFMRSWLGSALHRERTLRALDLQHVALRHLHEAARRTGFTHRHFDRVFSAGFGMRPKLFQRLARAEAAMRDVLASGTCGAGLALRHGYYDQSHLGRDFRALAGASPGDLLAAIASPATAHWPLAIGAGYAGAKIRPDFPEAGMDV